MKIPKAFISYSWDNDAHKKWVVRLATRLRADGIEVILDQWHAVPGDQLPQFMEREIRENDYILIVCTPTYKQKSDKRTGGVGYEGDIMTAEVFSTGNHRKFIPILAQGTWSDSAPSWLAGKYYIDLSLIDNFEKNYLELLSTIHDKRQKPPPVRENQEMQSPPLEDTKKKWSCPICGTVVDDGRFVCLGCHAEVVYGATKHEREKAAKVGMGIGFCLVGLLFFALPNWLNSTFKLQLPPAFGLGIYSFLFGSAIVISMGFIVVRLEDSQYRGKPPRFIRNSIT
ncbi:MAG: toll/interleukin-1 receptor domain-containing protein [Nitrospirota bacterium]